MAGLQKERIERQGPAALLDCDKRLLGRLGAIDPTLRAVVEMKAFEGLSREEMAGRMGCSGRTVARHWEFAQHWLQDALAATRDGVDQVAAIGR